MNVQMDMPIYVTSHSVHQHFSVMSTYVYNLNRRLVFYGHVTSIYFTFFALLAYLTSALCIALSLMN